MLANHDEQSWWFKFYEKIYWAELYPFVSLVLKKSSMLANLPRVGVFAV